MKTLKIDLPLTNRLARAFVTLARRLRTRPLPEAESALLRYVVEQYLFPRRRR